MKFLLPFIILFLFSNISYAQWNAVTTVNTPVCAMPNKQEDARVVSDGKAGAIISWVDYRVNASSGDIYAQRLDRSGIAKWTTNGKVVCSNSADQTAPVIAEADNGSAIIVWQDWRSGDRDIYAQKVDSSGNMLWLADGAPVCIKSNHQRSPKVTHDGMGGAFIVWEDSTNNGYDIYAQHLDAAGNMTYNGSGVSVCAVADAQINPRMISDDAGGVIIAWQDRRDGLEYKVYAHRLALSGNLLWTANGVALCSAAGGQTNLKMQSDANGGAYITWQDKRTNVDFDVYAQRIDGSGNLLWPASAIAICTTTGNQSAIDMATDGGINGAIISWKDDRTGSSAVYAQRIGQTGVVAWGANGIGIGAGLNPNIIGDTFGGAILTWQDESISSSNYNIYAQRLNDAGTRLWTTTGIPVCTAVQSQFAPKHVGTGDGGAIFVWDDFRNGSNLDVYAHKFAANGTVTGINNVPDQNNFIKVYPNPVIDDIFISISLLSNLNDIAFEMFDIQGKRLFAKTFSSNLEKINTTDLDAGIYFYLIKSEEIIISSGKLILSK